MAGRGDPPEGTPEGIPGGDDEYGSVVFDESFVRAARIQEFSATERMRADARAVQPRRASRSVPRQALILMLVVVLAFGMAIYLGARNPYQPPRIPPPPRLAITLIPLAPAPGSEPASGGPQQLFESSPAAHYRTGAQGLTLPGARRTPHFSESQVMRAITSAKQYLEASSLDPAVLLAKDTRAVRRLLDPAQHQQFDRSLRRPADNGLHAATGWLVRFDPRRVALAAKQVRVSGTMRVRDQADALLVQTDHTFVYAVQPARTSGGPEAVLFTVRREMQMRFDEAALKDAHVTLLRSAAEVGPQRCSADGSGYFQPVLAGESGRDGTAERQPGTDPYDRERPITAVCGTLATAR